MNSHNPWRLVLFIPNLHMRKTKRRRSQDPLWSLPTPAEAPSVTLLLFQVCVQWPHVDSLKLAMWSIYTMGTGKQYTWGPPSFWKIHKNYLLNIYQPLSAQSQVSDTGLSPPQEAEQLGEGWTLAALDLLPGTPRRCPDPIHIVLVNTSEPFSWSVLT